MKEEQIVAALKLKPEAPIGGLKYYLVKKPLDALSTLLLKGGNHHDKVALHFLDQFTVVCADVGPMNQFLQDKGQPKAPSKQPVEEPKGGQQGGPGGAPGMPGGGMPGGPPGHARRSATAGWSSAPWRSSEPPGGRERKPRCARRGRTTRASRWCSTGEASWHAWRSSGERPRRL